MRITILSILACSLLACKAKQETVKEPVKTDTTAPVKTSTDYGSLADTLKGFKFATLSIAEERSDMDHLIPVGYNSRGSFAYFIDEDMGGAAGFGFHISPAYDQFSLQTKFDAETEGDSLFIHHSDLIGLALKTADIQLNNSIQRITVAELEKRYGVKIGTVKTMGAPNPDWDEKRKTLASIHIDHNKGTMYPTDIKEGRFTPSQCVWDIYVSDIILVPGSPELGMFAFAVVVTESLGFEGYTRKSIEIVSLGNVSG